MRRLYFLAPSVDTAGAIVDDFLLARTEERHIHLIAKEGTPLGDLPEVTLLQKSDFIPAIEKGLAVGGTTDVVAGIVATTFPPAGLVLGGGAVLAIALAGAGMGALLSSMIGISANSSRLRRFEEAIERGEVLMLVGVPKTRVDEIEKLVQKHHPEVGIQGTEPTIPAFP